MESGSTATDLASILALETAVWDAMVTGDVEADANALDDDFVGIYPTGFADKGAHVDQLSSGPTVHSYRIEHERLIPINEDATLLCYLATYVTTAEGASAEEMYVSSLWQRIGDRWVNTFSQDTPASGVEVP